MTKDFKKEISKELKAGEQDTPDFQERLKVMRQAGHQITPSIERIILCEKALTLSLHEETIKKEMREAVSGLFSVYPDGGIHDFKEDEELISKDSVLQLLDNKK